MSGSKPDISGGVSGLGVTPMPADAADMPGLKAGHATHGPAALAANMPGLKAGQGTRKRNGAPGDAIGTPNPPRSPLGKGEVGYPAMGWGTRSN
jgi:hypothetical protein